MADEKTHTLWLDAGHFEYAWKEGPQPRAVWSPFEVFDERFIDESEAYAAMREQVPPGIEVLDPTWCTVLRVSGTLAELQLAYRSLLEDVSAPPSGDDDSYDYWPSGCRMVMHFAAELDRLDAGARVAQAREVILAVIEAKGEGFAEQIEGGCGL